MLKVPDGRYVTGQYVGGVVEKTAIDHSIAGCAVGYKPPAAL
jgi:hypothetical protein